MKFGRYIRKQRERKLQTDKSFSLRGVSYKLGIQPSYLSKIERGEVPPFSVAKICELAEILGEDKDQLLSRADKISPDIQKIIQSKPKLFASVLRQIKDLPDQAVVKIIREVKDGKW